MVKTAPGTTTPGAGECLPNSSHLATGSATILIMQQDPASHETYSDNNYVPTYNYRHTTTAAISKYINSQFIALVHVSIVLCILFFSVGKLYALVTLTDLGPIPCFVVPLTLCFLCLHYARPSCMDFMFY